MLEGILAAGVVLVIMAVLITVLCLCKSAGDADKASHRK